MVLRTLVGLLVLVAAAPAARAALILEYIQVGSITAPPSNGPALTSLVMTPGATVFLQIALRDTLGSGPNVGQPGTVAWQTNGGAGGPGSVWLAAFFMRFDGIPLVAVNPAPTSVTNARVVNPALYSAVTSGTNPPNFTRIGGLLLTPVPGDVPDPATQDRIPLFNLRINALAASSGMFRLRDPNPSPMATDNSLELDGPTFTGPGTFISIDDLLFGPSFTNTFDLPVTVTPEPSSLALLGLAAAFARRLHERRR